MRCRVFDVVVALPALLKQPPANLAKNGNFCSGWMTIGHRRASERDKNSPIGKKGECATTLIRLKLIHSDPASRPIATGGT
jgi:hypothetical protein